MFKNAVFYAIGVAFSRVLGYLRDSLIAYYFGVSYISDAFFIAWRLPNTLRRLLGEGGINAAFVPIFADKVKEGKEREFFGTAGTFLFIINLIITIFVSLFSPYVIKIVAPGLDHKESYELSVFFLRFLIFSQIFFSLGALISGALNIKGVFFPTSFSQAIFNLSMGISLVFLTKYLSYKALVIGVLIGSLLQFLYLVFYVLKIKLYPKISKEEIEDIKIFLKRLAPSLLGFGIAQLSFFVDTFLASFLGKGAISYLYYANRIFQLPLGIFSVGLSNALLAHLSMEKEKKEKLTLGFLGIGFLTIPASFGIFSLSYEIVKVLYGHGKFNENDIKESSVALSIYVISLIFFSLQKTLSSYYFAIKNPKKPVISSSLGILVEGVSGFFFAFIIGLNFKGLVMGTVLSSITGFLFLLKERYKEIEWKTVSRNYSKYLVSSFLMSLILYFSKSFLNINYVLKLFLLIIIGAFSYFLFCVLLKEELSLKLKALIMKKVKNFSF